MAEDDARSGLLVEGEVVQAVCRVMCPLLPCDSVILHDMQLPSHSGLPKSPTLQPTLHKARPGRSPTIYALTDNQFNATQASTLRSDPCPTVRTRRQGSSGHITLVGVCRGVTVTHPLPEPR